MHGFSCSVACGIFPEQDWTGFPALAGRFPTTVPPGKYSLRFFTKKNKKRCSQKDPWKIFIMLVLASSGCFKKEPKMGKGLCGVMTIDLFLFSVLEAGRLRSGPALREPSSGLTSCWVHLWARSSSPPKRPSPHTSTLEIRFHHMNSEG